MKYFRPSEFREWWELMSIDLLEVLDDFRDIWGAPVMISPHADALGRHGGGDDLSQHNVDKWGEVRAADVFPMGLGDDGFIRAYDAAKQAGASGIGFYPGAAPGPMMHLDARMDRTPDNPATWSRIKGKYLSLSHAMPEGWKL
jgi:hypothetical protein